MKSLLLSVASSFFLFIGCVMQDDPEIILQNANESMGGQEIVSGIKFIYVDADCEGPSGPFRTRVWSSNDGRIRFEQTSARYDAKAGISENGG